LQHSHKWLSHTKNTTMQGQGLCIASASKHLTPFGFNIFIDVMECDIISFIVWRDTCELNSCERYCVFVRTWNERLIMNVYDSSQNRFIQCIGVCLLVIPLTDSQSCDVMDPHELVRSRNSESYIICSNMSPRKWNSRRCLGHCWLDWIELNWTRKMVFLEGSKSKVEWTEHRDLNVPEEHLTIGWYIGILMNM
jgi:hypothetical protein